MRWDSGILNEYFAVYRNAVVYNLLLIRRVFPVSLWFVCVYMNASKPQLCWEIVNGELRATIKATYDTMRKVLRLRFSE